MLRAETAIVSTSLTVWFWLAFAVGLTGAFENASAAVVALTVWGLTAFVLLATWIIRPVRHWALTVDLAWLIALHLTRFVGIYFLVLCRNNELSCGFAKPAGIGDILTAIGAMVLLVYGTTNRPWPALILLWNIFGLVDIIFVVVNALRVGLTDYAGMVALRMLPLMLLPTFLVPLIIASHILIFVRLGKSKMAP